MSMVSPGFLGQDFADQLIDNILTGPSQDLWFGSSVDFSLEVLIDQNGNVLTGLSIFT